MVAGLLVSGCRIERDAVSGALTPVNANCAPAPGLDAGPEVGLDTCDGQTVIGITANLPPPKSGSTASLSAAALPEQSARAALVVPPHLRTAETTGGINPTAATGKGKDEPKRTRTAMRLADAVASAVLTFPEIRINQSRVREASAGVGVAEAGLYPTLDFRFANGVNFSGAYEGRNIPYDRAANAVDARLDGGLILRQLVYDFGSTSADIDRARFVRDAEKMRLQEKIDDVAHRTSQTYLKIIETRALLALVEETIATHEELLRVVQAHQSEGHGTAADVQRVNARLVDVRAIRSDVSLQLVAAEDQLSRLTQHLPGKLQPVPDLAREIPRSSTAAIERVLQRNPRLGALQAIRQSTQKELESFSASILPRINLEVDSEVKNFRNGPQGRTQAEGRAMMAMRYRLIDGGISAATKDQMSARIVGADFSLLNEREQIEADIRQAYRSIDSAARKMRLVAEGVESAKRVRQLYLEQFKGGKRTVFELLDGQMSYYSIRRSQIENQFEGRRAMFDILKATGDLTVALSRRS
jgi:TolC family type I secretion outer membrane protein